MEKNYFLVAGGSLKESEIKLLGELLVASYNAHAGKQLSKVLKAEGSALEKHSFCLKKAESLKHEAETYRLVGCLYESTADRPAVSNFLDELVDLIK